MIMRICSKYALVVGVILGLTDHSQANQIQTGFGTSASERYGPYQSGEGGEFTLNPLNPDNWLDLSSYADWTTDIGVEGSFQTFCIEHNEYIYPYSATYDVVISDGAVAGGAGGPNPDPISLGTGWLYSQFASGSLSGYAYTEIGARQASAELLQRAIWQLEKEIVGEAADSNTFLDAVINEFGSLEAAQADGGTAQYGVYALNLTRTSNGRRGQDQLYYHIPDGGLTLSLLGLSLTVLGLVRRSRMA